MTRLGQIRGILKVFLGSYYAMMRVGIACEEGVGEPWGVAARWRSGGTLGFQAARGWGDALQIWRLCA
jgi:hypothetical protein